MKKLTTLALLALLISSSMAQDRLSEKGSWLCSQGKSSKPGAPGWLRSPSTPAHDFDVLNYTLNFDLWDNFDPPYPQAFDASEIIRFRVDTALSVIRLNAVNVSLQIHEVGLSGSTFSHILDTLAIQLDRVYNPGEIVEVSIDYSHTSAEDGAFYVNNGFVFTDNERSPATIILTTRPPSTLPRKCRLMCFSAPTDAWKIPSPWPTPPGSAGSAATR